MITCDIAGYLQIDRGLSMLVTCGLACGAIPSGDAYSKFCMMDSIIDGILLRDSGFRLRCLENSITQPDLPVCVR